MGQWLWFPSNVCWGSWSLRNGFKKFKLALFTAPVRLPAVCADFWSSCVPRFSLPRLLSVCHAHRDDSSETPEATAATSLLGFLHILLFYSRPPQGFVLNWDIPLLWAWQIPVWFAPLLSVSALPKRKMCVRNPSQRKPLNSSRKMK